MATAREGAVSGEGRVINEIADSRAHLDDLHRLGETVDHRTDHGVPVERVTDRGLERFFYDWLERPGNPDLDVTTEYQADKRQVNLVVKDMAAYSDFVMNTLLKHPSVQDCKTSFVLEQVKTTTALPI